MGKKPSINKSYLILYTLFNDGKTKSHIRFFRSSDVFESNIHFCIYDCIC